MDIGKYYEIKLKDKFGSKSLKVKLTATTNELEYNGYTKMNLRSEYFNGMGLSTYLSYVNKHTVIYICLPIKTMDPIKLEKSAKAIAIPQSIIEQTRNIIPCKKVIINLSNRYINNEDEYIAREEIAKLTEDVKTTIEEGSLLNGFNIKVDTTLSDILFFRDTLELLSAHHLESNQNGELLRRQGEMIESKNRLLIEQKLNHYQHEIDTMELSKQNIDLEISKYTERHNTLTTYHNELDHISDVLRAIVDKLRSGQYTNTDVPSYEELTNIVINEL